LPSVNPDADARSGGGQSVYHDAHPFAGRYLLAGSHPDAFAD
jgi:hypothetical protein